MPDQGAFGKTGEDILEVVLPMPGQEEYSHG